MPTEISRIEVEADREIDIIVMTIITVVIAEIRVRDNTKLCIVKISIDFSEAKRRESGITVRDFRWP